MEEIEDTEVADIPKTSSFDEEKQSSDTCHFLKNVCQIDCTLEEKLKGIPGAMEYIKKLHKIIEKYNKRIRRLREKLVRGKCKDASTQTVDHDSEFGENEGQETDKPISFAEDIKNAAETAMQNMGFVFEETSGMYYDYNTGYYYNAEYGLYYDDKTGTYMRYNPESQSYEFHSQVASQTSGTEEKPRRKRRTKPKRKDAKRQREDEEQHLANVDVEEGECSDSDELSSDNGTSSDTSDSSRKWPPCMRVVIKSTENPKMKVGSLYVITYDGGTLGREGNHSITIPDLNTSKHHLKFSFDKELSQYNIVDLGSRNGTFLNGKRMSPSKQESDPMVVEHGSKIQIGSTTLLCHVHPGSQTCGQCEPGLLQPKDPEEERVLMPIKSESYKSELKSLKKLYGVNYASESKLAAGYVDRAQRRRKTVGSQNPHEKTQVASVDESIAKENKGFKLLAKLGWKEGQALGKGGDGILEPVKVEANQGLAGVGCEQKLPAPVIPTEKQNIWKMTQERFDKLPDRQETFEG